jgi:LPXTG-motif cell wall-anchored protein
MPQSDQNAAQSSQSSASQSSTSTTTSDKTKTTSDQDPNNAAAGTSANGGKLPQTATPLPLLALLGMGSLTSGLLARRKK